MQRFENTVATAHELLDTYARLMSQTQHTQKLLLDGRWEAARVSGRSTCIRQSFSTKRRAPLTQVDVRYALQDEEEIQAEADALERERREEEERRARELREREEQERREREEAERRGESTRPHVPHSVGNLHQNCQSWPADLSIRACTDLFPTTPAYLAANPPARGRGTGTRGVRGTRGRIATSSASGIGRGTGSTVRGRGIARGSVVR